MPTLPGRATSILSVLAGASSARPNEPATFDWQPLVEAGKPGGRTESQRQQAARFKLVQQELHDWANAHGMSREHIEESALYATVSTPANTRPQQVLALAMTICWIYQLDDFLDRQDFSALATTSPEAYARYIDAHLSAILWPLTSSVNTRELRRWGLWLATAPAAPSELPGQCVILSDALRSLIGVLLAEWAWLPGGWGRSRFRLRLVAQQVALCAATMRREALWNTSFARAKEDAVLPEFADYLRGAAISIGMPAVAAVAASFEELPYVMWQRGQAAIAAGGCVVRLTNDLHTYFADVDEGKVSAITLRLRELGLPFSGLDPETSAEVREAQASVALDLAAAVADFAHGIPRLAEDGPLGYCVRRAVAFALAVYGDGSALRHERRTEVA